MIETMMKNYDEKGSFVFFSQKSEYKLKFALGEM